MQLTVRYKNLEGRIFGEWETWHKTEKNEHNRKIFTILMNDNKPYVSDQKSRKKVAYYIKYLISEQKQSCDWPCPH